MVKQSKLYLLLILCCLVAGCSQHATRHAPSLKTFPSWNEQVKSISSLNSWSIKGKLGFNTEKERGSALLNWKQDKSGEYVLDLYAPLNIDSIHIMGNSQSVSLASTDGAQIIGETPEDVAQQYIGWDLPLSGLWYWIRGIPIPNTSIEQIDISKNNLANYIYQKGWKVSYHQYKTFGNFTVPTNITLNKNSVNLKIIIRHWNI